MEEFANENVQSAEGYAPNIAKVEYPSGNLLWMGRGSSESKVLKVSYNYLMESRKEIKEISLVD